MPYLFDWKYAKFPSKNSEINVHFLGATTALFL